MTIEEAKIESELIKLRKEWKTKPLYRRLIELHANALVRKRDMIQQKQVMKRRVAR